MSGIYAGMSLFGFDPLALLFHTADAVARVKAPELSHTIPEFLLVDPIFHSILSNIVVDVNVYSDKINKLLKVLHKLNEN